MADIKGPPKDEGGVNPNIPAFLSKAPWYAGANTAPGASNKKRPEGVDKMDNWYQRGARVEEKKVKWKPGSCANCGASSHATKDCCERPRKVAAKFNDKNLMNDEVVVDVGDMGFDAKRDRWNGYDVNDYTRVMDRYSKVEEERRKHKVTDQQSEAVDAAVTNAPDKDKDKKAELVDPITHSTSKNLRIREDTAKYLRNLKDDSAFYDPKTRSMRANPTPDKAPGETDFVGDNFLRFSGDTIKLASAQLHALAAAEQGQNIHLQANPSAAEALFKQYEQKKVQLAEAESKLKQELYGDASNNKELEDIGGVPKQTS